MPIFDFQCPRCAEVFEKLVPSDYVPDPCPTCHDANLVKLWGIPAVHFKGTGFPSNDLRKETRHE